MDLKMSSEERQKGQVAELPLLEHMQERKQEQGHDGTQAGFVTVGLEGSPEQARPKPSGQCLASGCLAQLGRKGFWCPVSASAGYQPVHTGDALTLVHASAGTESSQCLQLPQNTACNFPKRRDEDIPEWIS